MGGRSGTATGTLAVSGLNISSGAPGINLLHGAVSVNGGRFSDNATAIEIGFFTTLRVSGATFTDNTATDGGAIYGTGSVDVTDSTFTRNSAKLGGAVYLQFGTQEITRCQFSGRFSRWRDLQRGQLAGLRRAAHREQELDHRQFRRNRRRRGGAVDQDWYATLTGDLFTRNTATASGGGIFNHAALGATAGIAGTTVTGNLPDNCAPPGAISGCAAMAGTGVGGTGMAGTGMAGTGQAGSESRRVLWRLEPSRSVPRHHGGHLPPLLLRELTGG